MNRDVRRGAMQTQAQTQAALQVQLQAQAPAPVPQKHGHGGPSIMERQEVDGNLLAVKFLSETGDPEIEEEIVRSDSEREE
ncbi:hypothetical protein Taro_049728 [Colocasia esculenta]|uniref:Uncharacterized protein n=1 Tax=Colocasia esculenta TaxID=4460 RepID=A0A843XC05_COLES|nr:hypothetical protein [Colocasia esculenta]